MQTLWVRVLGLDGNTVRGTSVVHMNPGFYELRVHPDDIKEESITNDGFLVAEARLVETFLASGVVGVYEAAVVVSITGDESLEEIRQRLAAKTPRTKV